MNRRLFYQYGMLLPRSPYGYVSQGLGQGVSAGAVGLIAPTRLITKPIEEIDVDGVRMVFQLTPVYRGADGDEHLASRTRRRCGWPRTCIAGLHNIYTLRGAPVRNPLNWSKYLNAVAPPVRDQGRGACSRPTIGRVGAMSGFRRCCAPSAISTPT